MQIWLHQLDGTAQLATVEELQQLIALAENTRGRLVCQGSHLTLENSDMLTEGSNVYVVGDLDGGKKKKKKKVYTTKKKNKHIHKRVKMSIYSLYSVDGIIFSM